jgi:sugar phosphate isomerase/epimerase
MISRRTFVKQSTLAAGAATLAAPAPGPQPDAARKPEPPPVGPDKGLRVGTVTYNIAKDWDVETIIRNLTEVGMEAVELRTTHRHGVELSLAKAARAEVKGRFADSAVRLASLGTTCEYHAEDPAFVRRNVEETKAWLQLAADVGAGSVKVRPNGLRKDVAPEATLEQIGRALNECGRAAADQGVKVQLEVHGSETSRLPNIRKILDHAGRHPAVWVCWNSNQTDLLDGGLESNFRLVQDRIGQVHMRDLYLEEYPWRRLVQLLQGIHFDGYCYAELGEPSSDGLRVLKYFHGMFRALQGIEGPPTPPPPASAAPARP